MTAQLAQFEVSNVFGPVLFYVFALLAVASAWAIVLTRNIVRAAVYLLITLGAVAGLYFLLAAELLAALQLIVYVGGTLTLIIFGVMLTSRDPRLRYAASPWEAFLAYAVSGLLMVLLLVAAWYSPWIEATQTAASSDPDQIHAVGRAFLSRHVVFFEAAAVLLLVAMVAAAYLARRRVDPPPRPTDGGNGAGGKPVGATPVRGVAGEVGRG